MSEENALPEVVIVFCEIDEHGSNIFTGTPSGIWCRQIDFEPENLSIDVYEHLGIDLLMIMKYGGEDFWEIDSKLVDKGYTVPSRPNPPVGGNFEIKYRLI